MIIEVILLILVVSYAIIRVKKPEILKYFTFIPVEKVLALDKVKEENKNNNTSTDKNGVKISEEESKYNIILKILWKFQHKKMLELRIWKKKFIRSL